MKKTILLVFLLFLAMIAYDCRNNQRMCGCKDVCVQYYHVKKPKISNAISKNADAPATLIYPINGSSSIKRDSFIWVIKFEQDTYCYNNHRFNSIFATATADPASPLEVCKEKIDSLTITTVDDYDDLHPAGSKINDITGIDWYGFNTVNTFRKMSLNSFMSNVNRPIEGETLVFYLLKPPKTTRQVAVNIHIKISDGSVFDLNSQAVTIEK